MRVSLLTAALLLTSACTVAGADSAKRVKTIDRLKDAPPSTLREFDAAQFAGVWYPVVSNFPFWRKLGRRDPEFRYHPIPHPTVVKYEDSVYFRERRWPREFRGVDIQDPTRAGHFQFQGDDAFIGVKNHWYVVDVDPDYRWAVVYFSRSSMGTPGGIEIMARGTTIDQETLTGIIARLAADPFLAPRARGLFVVRRGDGPAPSYDLGPLAAAP